FTNPQHHRSSELPSFSKEGVTEHWGFEVRFDVAFRENNVSVEQFGCIVLHNLERTLGLSFFKGEEELVKAVVGKLKFGEQRVSDPAPAIVGPEDMVFNYEHRGFRLMDNHLTGGNQNAEIDDGCLWPVLKAFRNCKAMGLVAEVELTVLRRTACPDQFVIDVLELEVCHRILDQGLLIRIKRLLGHVHDSNFDPRIQHIEKSVLKRSFQVREPLGHVALRIDIQRNNLSDRKFARRTHRFCSFSFARVARQRQKELCCPQALRCTWPPVIGFLWPGKTSSRVSTYPYVNA